MKRAILQSYVMSGNSERIAEIAKTEKDADLRKSAIRNLGMMNRGGSTSVCRAGECGADGAGVQDGVTGVRAAVDTGQHEIWCGTERASGCEERDEGWYRTDRVGVHVGQTVKASSFDDDPSVSSDCGQCGATSTRVVERCCNNDVQSDITRDAGEVSEAF